LKRASNLLAKIHRTNKRIAACAKIISMENVEKLKKLLRSGLNVTKINDSGSRTEFSTGAVRDMSAGKGYLMALPPEAMLRLSRHYEAGAIKYGMFNYTKGIPVSSFINSALRHLFKYLAGKDDEDHLAAVAFNVLGAMLMEETKPDMQDLPARKGKNNFAYFADDKAVMCGAGATYVPEPEWLK